MVLKKPVLVTENLVNMVTRVVALVDHVLRGLIVKNDVVKGGDSNE
tara:strand:+ start:8320 stop:8457 length:138 start_codon:yes stop_codon:yes gene_type:complete